MTDDKRPADAPAPDFDDAPGLADDAHGDAADGDWQPDPDAAPTVEGRVDQAMDELRKLLRASMTVTVMMGVAAAVWDVTRGLEGFPTAIGFVLGAVMATLNLWILAGGYFAIMRGQGASPKTLLAFTGSFLGLVMIAFFVVMAHREWTMGFALGLTTPAMAGLLYGRTLRDQ